MRFLTPAHQISKNYFNKISVASHQSENKLVKFISLNLYYQYPQKVISAHGTIW